MAMETEERLAYLRLITTSGIGISNFYKYIKIYKKPEIALMNIKNYIERSGANIKIPDCSEVLKIYNKMESISGEMLFFFDEDYPENLKFINDPPPVIFTKGNTGVLKKRTITVVGSRDATINGIGFTSKISLALGKVDFTTVSGMALGIDREVHRQAIINDYPTVAVLGTGVDIIYPYSNSDIYKDIPKNGLLLSEFLPNTKPTPKNFPRRNRVMSGLSLGTLVIEAKKKSGALITAYHALDQGRELFAVPRFPGEKNSGTNSLIRSGANLVESIQDIVDVLDYNKHTQYSLFDNTDIFDNADMYENEMESTSYPLDLNELSALKEILLAKMDLSPTNIEDIGKVLNVKNGILYLAIIELEIENKIIKERNCIYKKIHPT